MRRRKWGRLRLLLKLAGIAAVLLLVWVGYVQWKIQAAQFGETKAADVGIVLGAALWSDKPSPGLKERLDHAYSLYKAGKYPRLIVSGGLDGNSSKLTEAEGMRNYLIEKGIPSERIFLENEARSTYENLLFSQAIMERNGWRSALIVTHHYHGARAQDIANFIGMKDADVDTADSRVMNMTWHNTRETLAFTKWELDKLLMRLGLR
ncbi:YdcF family protein [Paenibacillus sp. MBLB4367]|uniref:YdcF family protein n=1 Tax=Paenibacillus sp. MBLB4367 TaxID=3384767 RepID=UPI003907E893